MLVSILGACVLILTGIAGAAVGLRVREQAAVRAQLRAYQADLRARAERRMAEAEAAGPRDRDAVVRELRTNGEL